MQGALASIESDPSRIFASFNAEDGPRVQTDDLTLFEFVSLIPDTISFEGGIFEALRNLSNISLDGRVLYTIKRHY